MCVIETLITLMNADENGLISVYQLKSVSSVILSNNIYDQTSGTVCTNHQRLFNVGCFGWACEKNTKAFFGAFNLFVCMMHGWYDILSFNNNYQVLTNKRQQTIPHLAFV